MHHLCEIWSAEESSRMDLSDVQQKFLLKVADVLENGDHTSEELHDECTSYWRTWKWNPKKHSSYLQNYHGRKQAQSSFIRTMLDKDFVIKRFVWKLISFLNLIIAFEFLVKLWINKNFKFNKSFET